MRLDRLDLTRYGRFTGARLDFPAPAPGAPDLHVIFGPNEAGKSTLFSAWLDFLYGIPLRTRYGFVHEGSALQIGATLTHAGGVLQAVRVKRNGPSLQDPSGQPLPEALMQTALAGLGREAYDGMFSLDDDTLKEGGDSILASRGELGEMLFAASAGLSGLGPQLDTLRRELDAFHKPRARATTLNQQKTLLADLDRKRRDLDTTAGAAQKLQQAVTAAEKAWNDARKAETAADTALQTIANALAVLPQQARLTRLRADLAPLAHLPEATEADQTLLTTTDQTLHGLQGQIDQRAETCAELHRRLTALPRDPAILPLADQIALANGLHPLHLAALADLPKRHDRLTEIAANLTRRMQNLNLTGPAQTHSLAPAQMARLRALLGRRDVATKAITLAQDEVAKAATNLATNLESTRATHPDPTPPQDLQSLTHLTAHLRQTDPEAAQTRAATDLAARTADLARAMLALSPWRGTPADLAALIPPAPWAITGWQSADQTTRRALAGAEDAVTRRRTDLANHQSAADPASTPSLTDAARTRAQREAAWATHLAHLTAETAADFETALRLDDRLTLHLAEATAAAQHAAQAAATHTRLTADLALAETALQTCQTDRKTLLQTIADCTSALGLPGAELTDLPPWLARRDTALAALVTMDQAQTALTLANQSLTQAATDLAAAMSLPPVQGFAPLLAEAQTRIGSATQSAQIAQRLTELAADLTERQTRLTQAQQALADWRADWQSTRSGAALTAADDQDPGLAALLDDLDALTRLQDEYAELSDRIAKMEENSDSFQTAAAVVMEGLSLPLTTPWAGIGDRLIAAQRAERDHASLTADLTREQAAQMADQTRAAAQTLIRAALADRLAWPWGGSLDHPPDTLAAHLANCLRASQLRRDIAGLQAELSHHPAPLQDVTSLQAEAARLQDAQSGARATSEARFAELTEARRALNAIGGDDAVALLAAERANLLNALKDQARSHLAGRFGLMAFEQGLRRYRDGHRSAMLAAASHAFSHLTCGEYTGLAAQPDGLSEVLVAIPAKGGSKLAVDLSKGTRFQLYLALRIAGYHELAKSRPPVPFIADDIMETFDDARAARAFALLGEMSRHGQVIYLTHHQHLCDIAVNACPGTRLVNLSTL